MKSTVIFILLLACSCNLDAQILSGYGVKLGTGISNMSWVYPEYGMDMHYDNKTGLSARLFADVFDFSFIQLELETGFTRKGFREKIPVTTMVQPDGTGEFFNIDNTLDYLSFSALAKVKYRFGIFTPYIIAGPQLGFLVNKNIEKGWEIVFDKLKKNNIGLSVGAGSEIGNILPFTILVEYRFEKDFKDNYDPSPLSVKNYSHVILVGVRL